MIIPQILMIVLFAVTLLLTANKHDKPREGKYNFWSALIAIIIQVGLLYWGGFFSINLLTN